MRSLSIFLIFLTTLFSGCINRGDAEADAKESRPLFFILHAPNGRWVPDLLDESKGKLTLINVDQSVVFFTDEDAQTAGKMKIEKFIEFWESGTENHEGHPIHAGLLHYRYATKEIHDLEILLSDPVYDAENETLSFRGELIGSTLEESEIGNTNIYIDDSSRYVYSNEN
jgi:hypothetical protein